MIKTKIKIRDFLTLQNFEQSNPKTSEFSLKAFTKILFKSEKIIFRIFFHYFIKKILDESREHLSYKNSINLIKSFES